MMAFEMHTVIGLIGLVGRVSGVRFVSGDSILLSTGLWYVPWRHSSE